MPSILCYESFRLAAWIGTLPYFKSLRESIGVAFQSPTKKYISLICLLNFPLLIKLWFVSLIMQMECSVYTHLDAWGLISHSKFPVYTSEELGIITVKK